MGLVAYTGEGTELSSSSKRLSTLGRASSITLPAPPRLGFSSVAGVVLPAEETPFSWIWWMMLLEGSGGAASSVTKQAHWLPFCPARLVKMHLHGETKCTFCGEGRGALLDSIQLQQQAVQLRQVASQR